MQLILQEKICPFLSLWLLSESALFCLGKRKPHYVKMLDVVMSNFSSFQFMDIKLAGVTVLEADWYIPLEVIVAKLDKVIVHWESVALIIFLGKLVKGKNV